MDNMGSKCVHIRDREAESTTYPTNLVVIKSGEKSDVLITRETKWSKIL